MGRKRDKERLLEAAGRHDAIKAVYELALSFRWVKERERGSDTEKRER